jgi:hypothetical protein
MCRPATVGDCRWRGRPAARPTWPPAEFRRQRLGARDMFETCERRELLKAIGVSRHARREMLANEGRQRCGLEVGNHRHPQPSGRRHPFLDGHPRLQVQSMRSEVNTRKPTETGVSRGLQNRCSASSGCGGWVRLPWASATLPHGCSESMKVNRNRTKCAEDLRETPC